MVSGSKILWEHIVVVDWVKCVGDVWCKLSAVNLDHAHFDGMEGVYVIWHGGQQPRVVYIGQGVIRDRLQSHRTDPRIQHYADLDLYVTWAQVGVSERDGMEAYLADHWRPKVGDAHPDARPIETNSPW